MIRLTAIAILLLYGVYSEAHPVASEGTLSFLGETTEEEQHYDIIYSQKYYWGFGVKQMYSNQGQVKSLTPMISYLAKRWNAPSSQANLYFYGGVGHSWLEDQDSETNYLYGVQADWETRRYYTMFKHEKLQSKNYDLMDSYTYRLGIAPYLAKYDELNTWLIIQAEQNTAVKNSYDVSPVVRVFYKNILGEIGRSHRGNTVFNFMVHYFLD